MDHSSPRDKDGDEDDVYEDDVDSADAAQLFQDSGESNEETSTKEETQIDDQEELEVGERWRGDSIVVQKIYTPYGMENHPGKVRNDRSCEAVRPITSRSGIFGRCTIN